MKYPIKITEIPHSGQPKTWILYDENHLEECIEFSEPASYTDFHINEGTIIYEEDEDGELVEVMNEAHTLDAYLEWLRHDLSGLEVNEEFEI